MTVKNDILPKPSDMVKAIYNYFYISRKINKVLKISCKVTIQTSKFEPPIEKNVGLSLAVLSLHKRRKMDLFRASYRRDTEEMKPLTDIAKFDFACEVFCSGKVTRSLYIFYHNFNQDPDIKMLNILEKHEGNWSIDKDTYKDEIDKMIPLIKELQENNY